MREIASKQQLRLAYMRWAVVTVPFILLLGFTSARLVPTGSNNRWYAALVKPVETPPDWAFPLAWTTIYVLMGLALAMIIHARGSRMRGPAIVLFAVQMAVNLIWSPLFFGAHQVFWAFIVLCLMFVLALATTIVFGRVRTAAAWLFVPYLAWLVYAGILNVKIDQLNPNASTLVPSSATTQIDSDIFDREQPNMQSDNKLFDDFAKFVNGAAGTLAGVGREAEAGARARAREWIGGLDFVSRDEFEVVKAMAAAARDEADALRARLDALEAKASKPKAPKVEL